MARGSESFLYLYTTQYNKLIKAAYRMIGDMECAQDLVQQVFLLALVRQGDLSTHPLAEGWLMLTLRNLVKNERRKQENHLEVSLDALVRLESKEVPMSVKDILPNELSPEEREILILRYDQQMEYSEMAKHFGISESGCRSRVFRAITNCRKYMKET